MAGLTLRNVLKSYGDVQVMHGVDLDIEHGEFVVFVGPSGCGKSTLLRMIAGLEEISGGTVKIGDKVVNDVAAAKRGVAMVFQSYALYPHMSVYKNMAFGLKQAKPHRPRLTVAFRLLPRFCSLAITLTVARVTFRVVSVSVWRLAVRLCAIQKCSCLTNRFPTWMLLCAYKPVWKSRVFTSVLATR